MYICRWLHYIAWHFVMRLTNRFRRAKGSWALQNGSASMVWIPKEKFYENELLLLCMIIVIIMMCGKVWGFRKINFPNWIFNEKMWVQWSQHSYYVDVDIVPCSIRGMEALSVVYPWNSESWEGCATTHSPRCVMMTSGFLLGKLGWQSWNFWLWVLTRVRSCSWRSRVV